MGRFDALPAHLLGFFMIGVKPFGCARELRREAGR